MSKPVKNPARRPTAVDRGMRGLRIDLNKALKLTATNAVLAAEVSRLLAENDALRANRKTVVAQNDELRAQLARVAP